MSLSEIQSESSGTCTSNHTTQVKHLKDSNPSLLQPTHTHAPTHACCPPSSLISLDEWLITGAMCSCLHLFKFQAGSGVAVEPAASPLLSPEHMHTDLWLQVSEPTWGTISRTCPFRLACVTCFSPTKKRSCPVVQRVRCALYSLFCCVCLIFFCNNTSDWL